MLACAQCGSFLRFPPGVVAGGTGIRECRSPNAWAFTKGPRAKAECFAISRTSMGR